MEISRSVAVSGATDIALSLLALYVVRKSTENQGSWSGGSACAILGVLWVFSSSVLVKFPGYELTVLIVLA